jgi:hypothetical protein
MIHRRSAALAALFVALAGSGAHASPAERIGPQFFGGAASVRDMCQLLARTGPPRLPVESPPLHPSVAQIGDCLQLLRAVLSAPPATTLVTIQGAVPGLSLHGARYRQLLSTYRAAQRLEPWVKSSAGQPGAEAVAAELTSIEADALAGLNAHGLAGARYAASVRGGFAEADPGGYAGRSPGAPNQGVRSAIVQLDVETVHVDIGSGWDAALGFEFGRAPLLSMVKTTAAAAATPAYVDGFTTSTAFRLARGSTSSETAIVGRVGAARRGSEPLVVGRGDQTQVVVAADNGSPSGRSSSTRASISGGTTGTCGWST